MFWIPIIKVVRLLKRSYGRLILTILIILNLIDQPPIKKVTPTMKSTYKVLHLTDIHYEINYAIGSLAFNCGVSSVNL